MLLSTNVDHNIKDIDFKLSIAKTAELIRYGGQEYLSKLQELNSKYDVVNSRFLEEKEFNKLQRECSAAKV
jgi:hypothetical protein